jgi:hypothetical protein
MRDFAQMKGWFQMDQSNSTTKPEGYNMTLTKGHDLIAAVKKFIDRRGKPPREIKPLHKGKYVQLCEDEPVQEGGE